MAILAWISYKTHMVPLIPVGLYSFSLPCNLPKVMCMSIDMHHTFLGVMGAVLEEADDLPCI